jgi:DNA-binding NarL/FixJ family response regulator
MNKRRQPAPELRKLAAKAYDLTSEARLASMLAMTRLRQASARADNLPEQHAPAPVQAPEQPENPSLLSKREEEMLQALARGLTTKEAAHELGIAFKTAASHRASIMEKLEVHEAASMMREAIRRGIIRP